MTAAASSESECVALAEAVNELHFLRQVKGFLTPPIDDNIITTEDNEGAIKMAYEARERETPHRPRCSSEWCSSNPLRQVGGATCRCADESVGRQDL